MKRLTDEERAFQDLDRAAVAGAIQGGAPPAMIGRVVTEGKARVAAMSAEEMARILPRIPGVATDYRPFREYFANLARRMLAN